MVITDIFGHVANEGDYIIYSPNIYDEEDHISIARIDRVITNEKNKANNRLIIYNAQHNTVSSKYYGSKFIIMSEDMVNVAKVSRPDFF
jgi:hypothetical protein